MEMMKTWDLTGKYLISLVWLSLVKAFRVVIG